MDTKPARNALMSGCMKLVIILLIGFIVLVIGAVLGALGYRQFSMNQTPGANKCNYNGVDYEHGADFDAPDGCNTCVCANGAVACTDMACNEEPDGGENMCEEGQICGEDLPSVVYERPGLLTVADKAAIEDKLIEPYILYNKGNTNKLVSIDFEVPAAVGQPYIVRAVFMNDITEGFVFGERGEPIDWWVPTCMDTCVFTDEFEAAYPEIVDLSTP